MSRLQVLDTAFYKVSGGATATDDTKELTGPAALQGGDVRHSSCRSNLEASMIIVKCTVWDRIGDEGRTQTKKTPLN
jgi:hypothetical protein